MSRQPLRSVAAAVGLLAAASLLRALVVAGPAWGGPLAPVEPVAGTASSPPGAPDSAATGGAAASAAQPAPAPLKLPAPSKAFGDLGTGKVLFESTCMPCHGQSAEGNPAIGAPALNRQEPWYLLAQLRKFRSGLRGAKDDDVGGQMMSPMAKSLPDEQALLDVATYVSSLVGVPPAPTMRGDRAGGERTFRTICTPCHGVNGVGRPELRTPALIGQADWYIVSQLRKFRRGIRGYHEMDVAGLQMRGMATALSSDRAVIDVAVYIASLAQ
jgi:cytochrome c oxidase subunit 2